MAKGTQQRLYIVIAKAYIDAVQVGADRVAMHIEWLAEILDYLDGSDISETKIFIPQDDLEEGAVNGAF